MKKVFLLGHSFGTLLGMRVCKMIPDKIEAYIGMSQLVNMKASEQLCIEESLKLCELKNDMKSKAMIERSITHFKKGNYPDYIMDQRLAMTKIGGFSFNRKAMNPSIMYLISDLSPHVSLKEAFDMKKGMVFSTLMLWNEVMEINLIKEIPSVEVPVYLIEGVADIVASPEIAKDYLELLEAPSKELVLFNASGHMPQAEETTRYENEVIRLFLNK